MGIFRFKQFDIDDRGCGMKICSDSVTFGAWFLPPFGAAKSVLDIGAGSGLLALMAAQCMPSAIITGIEIEECASEAAAHNFKGSPWAERLTVAVTDFSLFELDTQPDIIISNPPFFTSGMLASDVRRAGARHEATLTAASLLSFASRHLHRDGHLGVILPADRVDDTVFKAELAALKLRRLCFVVPRAGKAPVRALFDFSPSDGPITEENIVIRNADGEFTPEYISLVQPFYTKIS